MIVIIRGEPIVFKSAQDSYEKGDVYGVTWAGLSQPSLTRTDSAAGFPAASPYYDGAETYSSPFDDIMPWAGMERVTDPEAGELVKIPKFWYKLTQKGVSISIQISNKRRKGFSVCPACMDRGDGKGERDFIYVGRYHCAANTYKSTSGVTPQVSVRQSQFRKNIHNLGSNVYMMDFATRFTIWLLYIVEFANWNSQETIGYGGGNGSSVLAMGYTDSMPYHTGTILSSRTTYGLGTQYRYIEGLWENCYDNLTGCYNASTGLMVEVNPANFSENNSGGVSVGIPSNGTIAGLSVSTSGPFPCFISSANGGSGSTYVCDTWQFYSNQRVVCVGGWYGQSVAQGLFCVVCVTVLSNDSYHGSRLMVLP